MGCSEPSRCSALRSYEIRGGVRMPESTFRLKIFFPEIQFYSINRT
jgi:hypothetical protein